MNFYNTNFKTRYQSIENDDEGDVMYRKDLLEVFFMDENVEFDVMTNKMGRVYQHINDDLKCNTKFKKILEKSAARLFSEDLEIGFTLLYSYDSFYLVHELLTGYFIHNEINEGVLEKILNII